MAASWKTQSEFRPDLQGLRAIAVFVVILAHAGIPWAKGGFVGVDVFFVLSGYLISGLLFRELQQSGRIDFLAFYARRLKRLLPTLILVVATTAAASAWLLSSHEIRLQLASAPYAVTWTSNLHFSFRSVDYFDELSERDLFLHAWSLAVEEQFYLLWPLVLAALFLIGAQSRVQGDRQVFSVFHGLVVVFSISFATSLYLTATAPQLAFYMMPSRVWQFAIGAMIYLAFEGDSRIWSRRTFTLGRKSGLAILAVGLALILGTTIGLDSNLAYPGIWALAPSLGAAAVIVAGYGLDSGRTSPLGFSSLVWVGDRSYSLYLWHWPILLLGFSLGLKGQAWPILGLILFTLLAAMFSYRAVELPFWKGRFSGLTAGRVLLTGTLTSAFAVLLLSQFQQHLVSEGGADGEDHRWRIDYPEIYSLDCDAWYAHSRVEPCEFGDPEGRRSVVFLGDSIGAQWFSMIPALFPKDEWRITIITKSACPIVDEEFFYRRIGGIYKVCTDWRNAAVTEIAEMRPDVLIIGSASGYDFTETQWIEGSARVLARLSMAAGRILLIPGTPDLGFDGPGCLARNIMPGGRADRDACIATGRLRRVEAVSGYLARAASRFSNVDLLDLNDMVCPGGACYAATEDSVVVFRDSQHLTDSFVRANVPFIQARLNRIFGPPRE